MKSKYILIAFVIAGVSSCSTAYKIGQTPDDVYFSPAPPQNSYVQVVNDEDRDVYDNSSSADDREIRRRVNNRISRRDPLDYGYDYSSGYGFNNYYYSGYNYNNYNYSSPYGYYSPVYLDIKTPAAAVYKAPRKFNMGTYRVPPVMPDSRTNRLITNSANTTPVRSLNRPAENTRSGVGNFIRKVLSNPGSVSPSRSNDNDNSRTRTFEPARTTSTTGSSSAGSSSSGSSGGNAPVRSFNK